jgi:hypothetical protein
MYFHHGGVRADIPPLGNDAVARRSAITSIEIGVAMPARTERPRGGTQAIPRVAGVVPAGLDVTQRYAGGAPARPVGRPARSARSAPSALPPGDRRRENDPRAPGRSPGRDAAGLRAGAPLNAASAARLARRAALIEPAAARALGRPSGSPGPRRPGPEAGDARRRVSLLPAATPPAPRPDRIPGLRRQGRRRHHGRATRRLFSRVARVGHAGTLPRGGRRAPRTGRHGRRKPVRDQERPRGRT